MATGNTHKNLKFGGVVFEICGQAHRQKHTDTLSTMLCTPLGSEVTTTAMADNGILRAEKSPTQISGVPLSVGGYGSSSNIKYIVDLAVLSSCQKPTLSV